MLNVRLNVEQMSSVHALLLRECMIPDTVKQITINANSMNNAGIHVYMYCLITDAIDRGQVM